jgi:hypothetical protein
MDLLGPFFLARVLGAMVPSWPDALALLPLEQRPFFDCLWRSVVARLGLSGPLSSEMLQDCFTSLLAQSPVLSSRARQLAFTALPIWQYHLQSASRRHSLRRLYHWSWH